MKYTVLWKTTADDQLMEIWLNAVDRSAVTVAADVLSAQLRDDPATLGESREGLRRFAIQKPLAVHFEVHEADRQVVVLHVQRVTTRHL